MPLYCFKVDGEYEICEIVGGVRQLLYHTQDVIAAIQWAIAHNAKVVFYDE